MFTIHYIPKLVKDKLTLNRYNLRKWWEEEVISPFHPYFVIKKDKEGDKMNKREKDYVEFLEEIRNKIIRDPDESVKYLDYMIHKIKNGFFRK